MGLKTLHLSMAAAAALALAVLAATVLEDNHWDVRVVGTDEGYRMGPFDMCALVFGEGDTVIRSYCADTADIECRAGDGGIQKRFCSLWKASRYSAVLAIGAAVVALLVALLNVCVAPARWVATRLAVAAVALALAFLAATGTAATLSHVAHDVGTLNGRDREVDATLDTNGILWAAGIAAAGAGVVAAFAYACCGACRDRGAAGRHGGAVASSSRSSDPLVLQNRAA